MANLFGVFDKLDYKSWRLLSSLSGTFDGSLNIVLLVDSPELSSPCPKKEFEHNFYIPKVNTLVKEDLFSWFSTEFNLDKSYLRIGSQRYKPLLKFLLSIYCSWVYKWEYSLMSDNDLVILEDISEVKELVNQNNPFFISEIGDADFSPLIQEIFKKHGYSVWYKGPVKGGGYNVGFCGLNLNFLKQATKPFLKDLAIALGSEQNEWHIEQAFFVASQFVVDGVPSKPYDLSKHKYFFKKYDDKNYLNESKIFHCIFTRDKYFCDFYLSAIYPSLNANRYLVWINYMRQNHISAMLEIGVWRGDTTRMAILNSKNRDLKVCLVDLFEESTAEIVRQEVSLIADSLESVKSRLLPYSNNINYFKGFSNKVFPLVRDTGMKYQIIWIDGFHSYETVKSDFTLYHKLLAQGGVILFDDYTEDPHLPDVKRFIDNELMGNPQYSVTIRNDFLDHYRGFSYAVAEVRLQA